MVIFRSPFHSLIAILLLAAVLGLGWLGIHPPAALEKGVLQSPKAASPSIEPVMTLLSEGRAEEAIHLLAGLVKAYPGLADRGGAVVTSLKIRNLILGDGRRLMDGAADPSGLRRDLRFLQRRLAGGCS